MDDKLNGYMERHIRWQDITLEQLGYTNNVLLTIASGFLAFAFDKKYLSTLSFSRDSVFNLEMCFNIMIVLSLLISITYGLLTSLSRLYDFRITRQIVLIRQRFYDECKNEPRPLPIYDFPRPRFQQRFKTFFLVLFRQLKSIDKKEIKNLLNNKNSIKKFNRLRRDADTLGILTWRLLNFQFLFLMISMIFYSIYLFI